ncbi:DNA repair and recombination helicase protein PIF3 [Novymonas esmeraldas]|uniref:ATP-dependent DNA helicase n=1 Tax=Novymonas esmeraldas TaxID=1808958 RepID=A0AAW0ELU1_9TRYP
MVHGRCRLSALTSAVRSVSLRLHDESSDGPQFSVSFKPNDTASAATASAAVSEACGASAGTSQTRAEAVAHGGVASTHHPTNGSAGSCSLAPLPHLAEGTSGQRGAAAAAAPAPAAAPRRQGPAVASSRSVEVATQMFYATLYKEACVNPFNGRLLCTGSSAAAALFSIGFYRSTSNQLRLEWSPAEYLAALQTTATALQTSLARRRAREAQRERRAAKQAGDTSSHKLSSRRGQSAQSAAAALLPLTTDAAMDAARHRLLRPFVRRGPKHWMAAVVDLMQRRDVFTSLPGRLEQLYRRLAVAYVPVKLDAPVDPGLAAISLTPDQQNVMQLAMCGYSMFVGGSAGTGKTVLLKCIYRELCQRGLKVAMTATTGVAAIQLGGCTFHLAFNAPLDPTPHRWDVNALRAVDVVIIDEVSLLDAGMLDAFDVEARLARVEQRPFGGLQLIVCGDFLQLSRECTLPAYESATFKHLIALRLVTPMRHTTDDALLRLLEELRQGRFDATCFASLARPIPESTTHITYLFPRRREAQQLNERKLSELSTEEMTFIPQRGSLELYGVFTHSALIELDRDADGMRLPVPRREHVLEMIQEEAVRVCGGDGAAPVFIADHELVVMPANAEGAQGTRFVLRLRCRERDVGVDVSSHGGGGGDGGGAAGPTGDGDGSSITTTARLRMLKLQAAKVPRRIVAPVNDAAWEAIATAVAARVGGRLVAMLEREPSSLVPLSVSMTLADMSMTDVAASLAPLRLKLGCRVMVNRNLSRSVSNGSVGVVEAFAPPDLSLFPRRSDRAMRAMHQRVCSSRVFERLPIVRLLSGEVVQVPPVSVVLGGTVQSYYYGHEVLTLPLQLGYAFTVHKVQGLTLQGTVVLDCERFFDCAHLIYVACSRVRRLDQLIVYHVQPSMIIVRRSALEFSQKLYDASNPTIHTHSSEAPRASWTENISNPILSLSD